MAQEAVTAPAPQPQVSVEQLLQVIETEHRIIRQMKQAQDEISQATAIIRTLRKPYQDVAHATSAALRQQAKEIAGKIAEVEKPIYERMVQEKTSEGISVAEKVSQLTSAKAKARQVFQDGLKNLYILSGAVQATNE
jgi:cell division septum initiation protein DivIVA